MWVWNPEEELRHEKKYRNHPHWGKKKKSLAIEIENIVKWENGK